MRPHATRIDEAERHRGIGDQLRKAIAEAVALIETGRTAEGVERLRRAAPCGPRPGAAGAGRKMEQ